MDIGTMPRPEPREMVMSAVGKALIVVILLNGLFLILSLYSALLPDSRVASVARQAFETGALTTDSNNLPRDSERGYHQYNDCFIIQLIVNDTTVLDDALAPVLMDTDDSWTSPCKVLRTILFKGKDDPTLKYRFFYTRYWHGHVPIAASLLSIVDLQSARKILKFLVYLSVVLVAFSTAGAPGELRVLGYSITGVAAVFWALPYFGQSLGSAAGDAFLMLGVASFLLYRNEILRWEVLIPFCAAYGAAVTYLEFWTGQLPTAAGFLFVMAYFTGATRRADDGWPGCAWRCAIASLLAFTVGASLTVACKQVLALMLTDAPAPLADFTENFILHSSAVSAPNWLWGRVLGLLALLRGGTTLTYGSKAGAISLGIAILAAWCGALFLTWYRKDNRHRRISDLLALATGAAAAPAWAILFPEHIWAHKAFMSRMLIVPIALGVTALLSQIILCDAWHSRPRHPTSRNSVRDLSDHPDAATLSE
jgi:hypothetical protein